MKINKVSAMSFCLSLLISNATLAADKVGNGGNTCSMNFARLGRVVYDVIKGNSFYISKIDLTNLDSAISNTPIVVIEGKLYDKNGGLVPAKNDGVGKIYVSNEDWCQNYYIGNLAAIVLHEYLGISEPGRDAQYQLSGPLYVQTARTDKQFDTYLATGSDFTTQEIYFDHLLQSDAENAEVETKAIKEYSNVIDIAEDYRYQFKARISCTPGNERLDLYSLYAENDSRQVPPWFYRETYVNTFRFNDSVSCASFKKRAKLIGKEGLRITLGIDSLRVIGQI